MLNATLNNIKCLSSNKKWEINLTKTDSAESIFKYFSFNDLSISTFTDATKDKEQKSCLYPSKILLNLIIILASFNIKFEAKHSDQLKKDDSLRKYEIQVENENIIFDFNKESYDCIIILLNNFSLYNAAKQECYYNSQFKPLKPKYKVTEKTYPGLLKSNDFKNENAVLWLQFLVKTILRKMNYIKGNLDKSISTSKFGSLFIKFSQNTLSDEELNDLIIIAKYWGKNYLIHKNKNYLKELFYLERKEDLSDSFLKKLQTLYDKYVDPNFQLKDRNKNFSVDFVLKKTIFSIHKSIENPNSLDLYKNNEDLTFKFYDVNFSIFEKDLLKELKISVKNFKIEGFSSIKGQEISKELAFRNDANTFFNLYLKENDKGDLILNVDLVYNIFNIMYRIQ